MNEHVIVSVPKILVDNAYWWVLLKNEAVVKKIEVEAPAAAAADPDAYVQDNFATLWASPDAEIVSIGSWIGAKNRPYADYYFSIIIVGYQVLMADGDLASARGAALVEIQKDSARLAEYNKVRIAMEEASEADRIRFISQWLFAISGVLSGIGSG